MRSRRWQKSLTFSRKVECLREYSKDKQWAVLLQHYDDFTVNAANEVKSEKKKAFIFGNKDESDVKYRCEGSHHRSVRLVDRVVLINVDAFEVYLEQFKVK